MKYSLFLKNDYDIKPPNVFHETLADVETKDEIEQNLKNASQNDIGRILSNLTTSIEGLSPKEVSKRIDYYGFNEVVAQERKPFLIQFLLTFNNPLTLLLSFLVLISFITGDMRTAIVVSMMILISVLLKFVQETQAFNAAEKLKKMVRTTSAVIRKGEIREVGLKKIVPGDIISLSAGDMIPADVRLIRSKDLFINQSLLTGEAIPVEKHAETQTKGSSVLELTNICFSGTNVESGMATAVVLTTGVNTYFGNLAESIVGQRERTSFDKGVDQFTWLMIRFMLIMAPSVFLINGFIKHNWWEAFLFSISVAVGLTPEMLPAIVAINLSKGAISLSKKKVIVKRLNSIQNFGAIDILCTDKTGTLTQNKVAVIKNINIKEEDDEKVRLFGYLNSLYQTGFRNLLDSAILAFSEQKNMHAFTRDQFTRIDEIPFDFLRKRLSVVIEDEKNKHMIVCKGAVEEVVSLCNTYEIHGTKHALTVQTKKTIQEISRKYAEDGYRVIAIASRQIDDKKKRYDKADEHHMSFVGFITFLDPPKESARRAIAELQKNGITVKVLTGDNELVTKKICSEVDLANSGILLGGQIEKMSDEELQKVIDKTTIFAKLSPEHKKRIVKALQKEHHVVGFLGDGINDAPALRSADVGISVNSAVDIAKESADMILLESSLQVLSDGVIEGRRVFGNILKYIKMGASSNFGNMFSVIGASIFVPFLPMAPLQVLTNNLLYDVSQTAIPSDTVDDEYLTEPRKWDIGKITRFMTFIGPVSSVFDYLTFFMMLFVFNAWNKPQLFQTGWFVESLLTQTLIVHVIRSKKIAFIQTWASKPLFATTLVVMFTGIALTLSPLASAFGFVTLPLLYWPLLILMLTSYVLLTQIVKAWYSKKYGYY